MWKYIDAKDDKGHALHGAKGAEHARAHFEVRDTNCPVIETSVSGRFAVWCAAPLADSASYPALHHKPKADEDASKFSYVKGA